MSARHTCTPRFASDLPTEIVRGATMLGVYYKLQGVPKVTPLL